jgi:hypothetical protein
MAPFSWCERSIRAAQLVYEGRLTGAQIATEVGLSRQGLDRWKAHPEFKARVADLLAEFDAALRAHSLAKDKARWDAWDRQIEASYAAKVARRRR